MTKPIYNTERMSREVYCFHCKVYSITDETNPKCKECKSHLITVAKSIITGQRITGNSRT